MGGWLNELYLEEVSVVSRRILDLDDALVVWLEVDSWCKRTKPECRGGGRTCITPSTGIQHGGH